MLTALPADILRAIAGQLDARSQVYLGATCRACHNVCNEADILGIVTPQNARHVRPWLMTRGDRVTRMVMKRTAYGVHPWLATMPNLVAVRLLYCRVPVEYIDHLPPRVQYLDIHQLRPFGSRLPAPWTFNPISFVARLAELRVLRVTLTPRWRFVIVDNEQCAPALQRVTVRATAQDALAFVHRVPPGVKIVIEATNVWHSGN